jgi:hypothetical protein
MASRQVKMDPSKPLEVNVVSRSPHVVGYRIWTRPPGALGPWTQAADGNTNDNIPDATLLPPLPSGASLAYWFGVGGNPGTHYRALLILSQSGEVLIDGTLIEEGATDANGFAVLEREVSFL